MKVNPSIGCVGGLLLLVLLLGKRGGQLEKESPSIGVPVDSLDSLGHRDLPSPLFTEFLRGKFDQCIP